MKIIKASATIEDYTINAIQRLEIIGRTCYKSEDKITADSADKFIRMIVHNGHIAMLDHAYVSVRFICDRGVSHEIVRHRIGVGYAQESTRFCNYVKQKFGSEITVIHPGLAAEEDNWSYLDWKDWQMSCEVAEKSYLDMIARGRKPQSARSVLPNSLKTEIVVTGTFTYWRHFFSQRTSKFAHPQMREIVKPLLTAFIDKWAPAFEDLGLNE